MPVVAISVALRTVRVDNITFVSIEVVSDVLVPRTDKCYPLTRPNTTLVDIGMKVYTIDLLQVQEVMKFRTVT